MSVGSKRSSQQRTVELLDLQEQWVQELMTRPEHQDKHFSDVIRWAVDCAMWVDEPGGMSTRERPKLLKLRDRVVGVIVERTLERTVFALPCNDMVDDIVGERQEVTCPMGHRWLVVKARNAAGKLIRYDCTRLG